MEWWNIGMLVLKGSFSFLNSSSLIVKKKIPNNPKSHSPRTPGPDRLHIVFVLQWLNLNAANNILNQLSRTRAGHYSNIPLFQHPNWGVAPKFKFQSDR